jgi:hypothetical protein
MDHDSVITCLAIAVFPILFFVGRANRARIRAQKTFGKEELDKPLLNWTPQDPFRIRDLLRSFCVQGASGSGKSSGVALQLARALLADKRIALHIVGSKPEDREWWQLRFAEAGRANELRIVAPESGMHYNMLDAELKAGADDREIASILMTSGETLRRAEATAGGGGENDQFFRDQSERMLEMAVKPLRLATGTIRATDLQRFISGAAMSPEQLGEPAWKQGFHWKTLEAALSAPKSEIDKVDMEQCADYWLGQVPTLNDRTKTSIMVQVQGILHVMGSGVVRNLISSDTTLSPAMMDDGVSILVDMPGSRHGASGQFVNAVWRLGVQRHVLRRHAKPDDRIIVQWIDEFQNHAFSGDTRYLAECRSHRGCQIVLTQSLHAFYAAIKGGKSGEHLADALLTNYGTKCFCALGDAKTAEYASSLVGKSLQTFIGGSMAPAENLYDELRGRSKFTGSFSEHYENVLQANAFMSGLRTGGAENGYVVDAIVIRSGENFSNGSNWLRVAFGQK